MESVNSMASCYQITFKILLSKLMKEHYLKCKTLGLILESQNLDKPNRVQLKFSRIALFRPLNYPATIKSSTIFLQLVTKLRFSTMTKTLLDMKNKKFVKSLSTTSTLLSRRRKEPTTNFLSKQYKHF